MVVPLIAWEIAAPGLGALGAIVGTLDGPATAAIVPVQTELWGQQATLPAWSSAHAVFLPQQTSDPIAEHDVPHFDDRLKRFAGELSVNGEENGSYCAA